LRDLARRALAELDGAGRRVEITLVDDATSRRINREFLGRDRPTNVLSFPAEEPGELGQLVVNLDEARRQSAATGHGLSYLVGYYVLHGLLHLSGYDHERAGAAAAKRMRQREASLAHLLKPLVAED
jgi:probable rRNA maturation factor